MKQNSNDWKKREIKSLNKRVNVLQNENLRLKAQNMLSQEVKIYPQKNLLLPPGLFKSFSVKLSIPLREDEFLNRMKLAFPELQRE